MRTSSVCSIRRGSDPLALELAGVTLGVREGVIALIALVALYIIFVLLRMLRLHNRRPEAPPPIAPVFVETQPVEPSTAESPAESKSDAESLPAAAWEDVRAGLAEEALRRSMEQELLQLRDEVDAMRGELAALRQDMLQELAHMRAAQTVSPIYGDAMQMAVAGYDPAMIAERCGIARAEAELVVALANSQER